MIKVAHVITGLGTGGAETMLLRIVEQLRDSEVSCDVISLTDRGDLGARLEEAGSRVIAVGLSRSFFRVPVGILNVRRAMESLRPDVVQTWMYHADFIGGLAARLSGIRRTLWNVRQSNVGSDVNRASTMLVMWSCARLSSSLPAKIICNSSAAVRTHRVLGYDPSRFVVIPNGFDVERFRPDAEARGDVRRELGIDSEGIVLGYVARWDRQKDPRGFVLAAAKVMDIRPDVNVIMCGSGLSPENKLLREWAERTGHRPRFHMLGRREDMARITASFDVAISSSIGEGFSNAVGEAMASGVPCVVTDVGDSARVVGDAGVVVPAADPEKLAQGILGLLRSEESRKALGSRAREHIEREFSIAVVARRYVEVWKETLSCVD